MQMNGWMLTQRGKQVIRMANSLPWKINYLKRKHILVCVCVFFFFIFNCCFLYVVMQPHVIKLSEDIRHRPHGFDLRPSLRRIWLSRWSVVWECVRVPTICSSPVEDQKKDELAIDFPLKWTASLEANLSVYWYWQHGYEICTFSLDRQSLNC